MLPEEPKDTIQSNTAPHRQKTYFLKPLLTTIRWIAAIFITLMGIVSITEKSPVAGILIIALALMLIPQISARIKVQRVRFFRTLLASVLFVGFGIAATVAPVQPAANQHPTSTATPNVLPKASSAPALSSKPTPQVTPSTTSTPGSSVSPTPAPTPIPTPETTSKPTSASTNNTGYQWVNNGQGGVDFFNNGAPITRENFGTGTSQDVSKIEGWVSWLYTGRPNYQWIDSGRGGVSYSLDGKPITNEKFQAGVRALGDTHTDVTKIEAWVKRIYESKPKPTPTPAPAELPAGTLKALGARTKTSGCVRNGALPDKACTPGAIFSVTAAQVCVSGYSSSVRSVSEATKNAVYAEYGITSHVTGQYEVDHHISLELGGSNDISNLWPEPANPTPGFHQKDGVENSLHTKVCDGSMSLQTAQAEIADNWLAVYNGTYSNATPAQPVAVPTPTPAPAPAQTSSGSSIKMSTTSICHAPGDAYYDRTTNFTAYPTMAACIAAGGRASK